MFGKKKAEKEKQASEFAKKAYIMGLDYGKWESDFGFLTLCISRKTAMVENYVISVFSDNISLDKTPGPGKYIHDSDIMDIYEKTVKDVISSLSENYIGFLVEKYFKSRDELIRFVSESVYVSIVNSAISANKEKINRQYLAEFDKQVQKLNKLD